MRMAPSARSSAWFSMAIMVVCSVLAAAIGGPSNAAAEDGAGARGHERFGTLTRGPYQFGFRPLYDVVVFNDTDGKMFFEVAEFTNAVKRIETPGSAWEVSPGEVGRTDILAHKIDAGFRTADGVYVLVEPRLVTVGDHHVALFHVRKRDLERAADPPQNEAARAREFRETILKNSERSAVRAAEIRGRDPANPVVQQSIYRLKEDRRLAEQVRDWLWVRERLDVE